MSKQEHVTKLGQEMNDDWKGILDRIRKGDMHAESALLEKFRRVVFATTLRKVRYNRQTAEDLTQDTLVILLSKARSGAVNEPAALPAFVLKIAENVCKNHRKRKYVVNEIAATEYSEDGSLPNPKEAQRSLFERLSDHEILELVSTVIDELPTKRDRELLQKFYSYDRTTSELAKELGLTNQAFHRVKHRAKERLIALVNAKLSSQAAQANVSTVVLSVILIVLLVCDAAESNAYFRAGLIDPSNSGHSIPASRCSVACGVPTPGVS